jgi:predicted metal-dependent peptidase
MWSTDVQTAATNGVWVKWNPYYFYFLSDAGRDSILVHEDWHVALMHMLRRGDRDPKIWNAACDTVLDNMMDLDGYCVDSSLFPPELFPPGCKTFVNHEKYGTMSAEEIYDDMIKNAVQPPPEYLDGDLVETDGVQHTVVNQVVAASHACSLAGGSMPGEIETMLKKFLASKLPWEKILHNFFNELANQDYSWARPNRRYQDVYLPSLQDDHGGLDHIAYFEDVSGSITEADSIRFNSEFKYVKERFQPEKMTLIQFDTDIQKEDVFLKDDPFDEVRIVGGGGTCLICVRDWIIEHQPTAVVIFSDLCVTPMQPLPPGLNVPIIWIAINNRGAKVNMGQLVHLNE